MARKKKATKRRAVKKKAVKKKAAMKKLSPRKSDARVKSPAPVSASVTMTGMCYGGYPAERGRVSVYFDGYSYPDYQADKEFCTKLASLLLGQESTTNLRRASWDGTKTILYSGDKVSRSGLHPRPP